MCVTSFPHTTGSQLIGLSHVVTSGPRVCTRASPSHPPPFATPKFPSNCSLLLLDLQQFKNQLFITPISLQQQQLISFTPHLNIHSLSGQWKIIDHNKSWKKTYLSLIIWHSNHVGYSISFLVSLISRLCLCKQLCKHIKNDFLEKYCVHFMTTEGAHRRSMTYDNHLIHPIYPIYPIPSIRPTYSSEWTRQA